MRYLAAALIAIGGIAACVYLAISGHPIIAVIVLIAAMLVAEQVK